MNASRSQGKPVADPKVNGKCATPVKNVPRNEEKTAKPDAKAAPPASKAASSQEKGADAGKPGGKVVIPSSNVSSNKKKPATIPKANNKAASSARNTSSQLHPQEAPANSEVLALSNNTSSGLKDTSSSPDIAPWVEFYQILEDDNKKDPYRRWQWSEINEATKKDMHVCAFSHFLFEAAPWWKPLLDDKLQRKDYAKCSYTSRAHTLCQNCLPGIYEVVSPSLRKLHFDTNGTVHYRCFRDNDKFKDHWQSEIGRWKYDYKENPRCRQYVNVLGRLCSSCTTLAKQKNTEKFYTFFTEISHPNGSSEGQLQEG